MSELDGGARPGAASNNSCDWEETTSNRAVLPVSLDFSHPPYEARGDVPSEAMACPFLRTDGSRNGAERSIGHSKKRHKN